MLYIFAAWVVEPPKQVRHNLAELRALRTQHRIDPTVATKIKDLKKQQQR